MSNNKRILITGDSGFIGSHLVNYFVTKYPDYQIHGLDILTYASDRTHTKILEKNKNYFFHQIDIFNRKKIENLFAKYFFTDVIHLAAESHVDNSINNPLLFANTNIIGTLNILDAFKKYASGRFHHVSTDEVYGDLNFSDPAFTENSPYNPSSPYSASKASSDHLVKAWNKTYNFPALITNCSNNYGPWQFPEKLIPLTIFKAFRGETIPIYGDGQNVRDWLHVEDHINALLSVLNKGNIGESYCIGGLGEKKNIEVVNLICHYLDKKIPSKNSHSKLIKFIKDRPGHDLRYSIDSTKIKKHLNWIPKIKFEDGLLSTLNWYLENINWLNKINKRN